MKKFACMLLSVVLLCAVCVMPAFASTEKAEEAQNPATKAKVSGTSETNVASMVHFIPTQVKVTRDSTVLEGYFVNLNTNQALKNFEDVEMYVYCEGELLLSGEFGKINSFTIQPLGVVYQRFDFGKTSNLSQGTYDCTNTDGCYVELYLSVYRA